MLMPKVRQLLLACTCLFASGAVVAYVKDYEILRLSLQIFACNCFGFWCGLMMIGKAMELDNFCAIAKALDNFYEDPQQPDTSKKALTAYAVDSLDAWINKQNTANTIRDN